MKIHSFALILVGLVLLSSGSFAYTIEGNSVFLEDAQASLKVTPHTAQYPTAEGYQQEFEICNKTGTDATLFGAYVFNNELEKAKAEYLTNLVYDENGVPTKTWQNVTSLFEKKVIGEKFVYAYTSGKEVLGNSCETWRITYKPNANDETEKWDLWLWVGEDWSCILDHSCIKELVLDPWWSGAGSEADPYLITDCNQLQTIDSYTRALGSPLVAYFKLANDIDCSSFGNFDPIGTSDTLVFHGQLNGNGHTISNVSINSTTNQDGGLFSSLYINSVLKDVGLIDFNVWNSLSGASMVASFCRGCLIENVYVQGGQVKGAGTWYTSPFPPLVDTAGKITNSYVMDTSVSGTGRVGGFVANVSTDANIFNCYTNASVAGTGLYVGGFTGLVDGGGSCTNCFWDTDTGYATSDCGTGKTTANMFKEASFTNWDFDAIWSIVEDVNYPIFLRNNTTFEITKINNTLFTDYPIFNYEQNGDVTINFNVFSIENNRLTVDLNYSSTGSGTTQGTGTVIVQDLNLTSTYCTDQDFTTDSECSYTWNYSSVSDGNYRIIGLIEDTTGTTVFDSSDANFGIFNTTNLNITTINGLDFKTTPVFAYGIDGNITLDFSVYNGKNRRLTVDLNYSKHDTQGTGTVIIKDLNLTTAYCTNQDFTTASECSYSWNYSTVSDGNYIITGLIKDTVDLIDFNTSDGNFIIANDVNIIILQPIDEDTGLIIPSRVVGSTIGYSVKITTDHTVEFYDNMIDLNGFSVAFQTNPVLITTDVNVPDEYYPRQYSIDFTEATTSYTLQPYLAPVANSGNFIFYVTNLTTTGPLSNVTIIINGIVPGADGVAIQEIITDAAGTATIPLLLDTEYTAIFYYDGILIHSATLVPTAGSLTYRVGLDIDSTTTPLAPIGSIQVIWSPTTGYILQDSDGTIDINAQIYFYNKTLSTMQIRVYDTNGCLYDNNFFTALWTDGNTIELQTDLNTGLAKNIYTGLACIFDTNSNLHSIFVTIDINSVDGNCYHAKSVYWQVVQLNNYQWNLWYRLGITAIALNPPGTKIITSIISFFVVFLAVFTASKTVGNSFFTAMVGLILLGLCVYFGWFDFLIFAFIAFATLMYAMYSWGKLG